MVPRRSVNQNLDRLAHLLGHAGETDVRTAVVPDTLDDHVNEDARPGNLVISEINYNPDGSDATEFVELLNVGSFPVDLNGAKLDNAVRFSFPAEFINPGERVVVEGIQKARPGLVAEVLDRIEEYQTLLDRRAAEGEAEE